MEIKDVKANQGNIDLVVEVVGKENPRTFEKFGKKGKVCNARVKDGSGEMALTLWNEDIDVVRIGDKIHLLNAWCSEFKGERQLSTGKFGKIKVVSLTEEKTVLTNDPQMLDPKIKNFEDEGEEKNEEAENLSEEEFEE